MSTAVATEERTELQDGFHEVEMDDYLTWPFVNSSLLGAWKHRTPRYFRWLMDEGGPDEDSIAKSLGSLTHTAILEPDLLDVLYVQEPDPDPNVFTLANGNPSDNPRATKAFKEYVAELEATGKAVVTREQWQAAIEMRDAVHRHRKASALLKAEGPIELSGIVTDEATGVRLKIRPDKLVNGIGANVNIKTSKNAAFDAWTVDLYKLGYYRDFAFYARALTQLGFNHRKPIALVIDSAGPPDDRVAVYEIDAGAMDAGHQLVEKYLQEIAECMESGAWTGHPQDITSISLPHWAWSKVDMEISE